MKYHIITGPESTGKTTLAKALSSKLHVPIVEEFARTYLESLLRKYTKEDLDFIALQQMQLEHQLDHEAIIICDTDLLTLYIWKMEVYNECDLHWAKILSEYKDRCYYLCTPDIPWHEDPLRENPFDRNRLYEVYKDTLAFFSLPYIQIRGSHDERFATVRNHLIQK